MGIGLKPDAFKENYYKRRFYNKHKVCLQENKKFKFLWNKNIHDS